MIGVTKIKPEKGVSLEDFPLLQPDADEVLIKVKVSGICGSDLALYEMNQPEIDRWLTLPIIIGHEFCGVVESVGSQVTRFQQGDRVSGETHIPCMTCQTCQTGKAHICPHQKNIGRTVNGSLAEYTTIPERSVRKAPPKLSDHEVAMLEPLGVTVHAVREKDMVGENVLILGCGPLGLMTIAVAKAFGAGRVFATSRTPEKLQKALDMGADQAFQASDDDLTKNILSEAASVGISTVIDMSGNEHAVKQGLDVLSPGGTMILVGIPPKEISWDVLEHSIYKEIKLRGVFGRTFWESWDLSEMLLEQGKINTEPLIGSTYALTDYEKAFADAFSGKFGRTFMGSSF